MDRDSLVRTFIAVAISLVIMLVWQSYFSVKPPAAQPAATTVNQAASTEENSPDLSEPETASPTLPLASPFPPPKVALNSAAAEVLGERIEGAPGQENFVLRSEQREIVLSALGARLINFRLLDHAQQPGHANARPLDLVSPVVRMLHHEPLYITTGDAELDATINGVWYVADEDPPTSEERARLELPEGTKRIAFHWADGRGLAVRKALFFLPNEEHLFKVDWELTRGGEPLGDAMISWGPGISRKSEGSNGNRYAYWGQVVAALPSEMPRYKGSDIADFVTWPKGLGPRWLALDSQYFSVALLPVISSNQPVSVVRAFDTSKLGEEFAEQKLAIETSARSLTIFGGPKTDELLKHVDSLLGADLLKLVDWGFFGVVARPLFLALKWIHNYVQNWGWAIVIITIVIKLVFFPITQKSMVTMRKTQQRMSKLQPKIRYIKEKYREKKDMESRKAMNEEMMALYSREGVNPMGGLSGCMPMLLQLPILWAMYKVLSIATSLRGAPFLGWIHDLSAADPYWITPLVMGATMLIQQLISMTKTEDPQQKSQQRMMLMMPLMFTYFFINLPAGLVLYWLTNNVLGIGQQFLINRSAAQAVPATAGTAAKKR